MITHKNNPYVAKKDCPRGYVYTEGADVNQFGGFLCTYNCKEEEEKVEESRKCVDKCERGYLTKNDSYCESCGENESEINSEECVSECPDGYIQKTMSSNSKKYCEKCEDDKFQNIEVDAEHNEDIIEYEGNDV